MQAPRERAVLSRRMNEREPRADELFRRLAAAIPAPACELDHENAWQLVVATILAAQSTDKRVNLVTPALFARWPTPAALGGAAQEDVEGIVRSTGFFRNKAKAIRETSWAIAARFGGEMPRTLEEAITLPGVARKTANVVIGTAYRIPTGIVVDTHVGRVSRRLGLTENEDPTKVERDLCAIVPRDGWIDAGHRMVLHGRYVCLARKPRCSDCPINELCPSSEERAVGEWEERAARERSIIGPSAG